MSPLLAVSAANKSPLLVDITLPCGGKRDEKRGKDSKKERRGVERGRGMMAKRNKRVCTAFYRNRVMRGMYLCDVIQCYTMQRNTIHRASTEDF